MFKQEKNLLRCDLHCHPYYSDGPLSPASIAASMKANGVAVFALTDHDTVRGLPEAREAAQEHNIKFFSGIELTIQWQNRTFHLLGLGLQALQQPLVEIQERREERNENIMEEKLCKNGISIDQEELLQHCGKNANDILNRSHIVAYLADKGYCKSYHESFRYYLELGGLAYVAIDGLPPEEGISWIHAAGGWAFIAHPYSLGLNWLRLKYYVEMWRSFGLDGLEISHPRTKLKERKRLFKLAQAYGMLYCVGSDYHCGETSGVLGLGTVGKPIELPQMPYMAKIL